ncbi:MAG: cytidine deaminase [Clostridiales bacterium]|nr:cytidine deaminase [Clostridiales bacterium]
MSELKLLNEAIKARDNAYAPYSGFKVGAAVLTRSGKIFCGCNVENAAYSACICAERVAISKAISEGERGFEAIAIVGGKDGLIFCPPCGECRQVLAELCGLDLKVILGTPDNVKIFRLGELLPMAFGELK